MTDNKHVDNVELYDENNNLIRFICSNHHTIKMLADYVDLKYYNIKLFQDRNYNQSYPESLTEFKSMLLAQIQMTDPYITKIRIGDFPEISLKDGIEVLERKYPSLLARVLLDTDAKLAGEEPHNVRQSRTSRIMEEGMERLKKKSISSEKNVPKFIQQTQSLQNENNITQKDNVKKYDTESDDIESDDEEESEEESEGYKEYKQRQQERERLKQESIENWKRSHEARVEQERKENEEQEKVEQKNRKQRYQAYLERKRKEEEEKERQEKIERMFKNSENEYRAMQERSKYKYVDRGR